MGATKKEIEKSFRQLAKTLHPDRTSNREANERFFETCDAKEVLLYHVDPEIEIDSDIEIDLDRFLLHHLDTEIDSDRARKLLRVSKDATKQEIEKSFRKLALTLHPDKTSDRKANERFPEAFNAKELLLHEIDLDRFLLHHLDTEIDSDRARKLLRVSKNATKKEIKNSFRQLALTLHPDRTSNLEAHERLLEAIKAKELLLHHVDELYGKLSMIFEESFQAIRQWLQYYKRNSKLLKTVITYRDENGETTLHRILQDRNPPIDIIKTLIKYAPEALQMSDDLYRLPIHKACDSGKLISCEVIQTLVKSYSESVKVIDSSGCLPLHYAILRRASLEIVNFLIDCYPEGVTNQYRIQKRTPLYYLNERNYVIMMDESGMLLLHHACKKIEFSADLIRVLVKAYPESWTIPDYYGKTPKQYLIESASRKDERGMVLLHRQAVHIKGLSVQSLNILHDAYPEAIQMQDNSGLLPIHHACLNEASSLDVLMSLLQLYPESIKARVAENKVHNNSELGDLRAELALIKANLEQIRLP
jgi:DnaJ-domain-containing protein 1